MKETGAGLRGFVPSKTSRGKKTKIHSQLIFSQPSPVNLEMAGFSAVFGDFFCNTGGRADLWWRVNTSDLVGKRAF